MILHTCSEAISLAKELENKSAKFYEELARKYVEDKDIFLSFAKENGKYAVQIERAYFGCISDALEGCFAFEINPDEYTFNTGLADNASYSDALNKAIQMEDKIIKFYLDAAEQSKVLMADVPRTFTIVAKKKGESKLKLEVLLGKGVDR